MSANAAAFYDPADHYWIVGGDESRVWSSARASYAPVDDLTYAEWLTSGARAPTRIASEAELWEVLAGQAPEKIPALPAAQDTLREKRLAAIDAVQFKIQFNHENRLRALEAKPAVTAAQFRAAIGALL